MGQFLIRRIISTALVLWGVSILIFGIIAVTPGDAARAQLGSSATEVQVNDLRQSLGLNDPIVVRYFSWIRDAFQGDFGLSYQHRVSALDMVSDKFVNTLLLAGSGLLVAVIFGVGIGIFAGLRPNTLGDRIVTLVSVTVANLPTFWLGLVLLLVFSLHLGWFPAVGMTDARGDGGFVDILRHLVLPTITVAVVPIAVISRLVRATVMESIRNEHVRTARAKGLAERDVILGHVVRNALPSFITIVFLQAGYLMGGSLVAEVVFSWPGMGAQLYTSVGARDVPVIMAVKILIAIVFTGLNFLADLLQGVVDPRLRLS